MFKHFRLTRTTMRFAFLFLAFAMALLLTYIPVYRYIYQNTLRHTLFQYQEQLNRNVDQLNSALNSLNNAILITQSSSLFRQLRYNTLNATSLAIELQNPQQIFQNLMSNDTIADAGIVFNREFSLTRYRSFSSSLIQFYPTCFQMEQLTYNEWYDSISKAKIFMPESTYTTRDFGTYAAVAYVRPWVQTSSYRGFFYVLFPSTALASLLASNQILENGYLRLSNSSGEILLASGHAEGQCYELSVQSQLYSLNVAIGVSSRVITEQMQPMINAVRFFCISISALTLLLILLFSHKSAAPINSIMRIVSKSKYVLNNVCVEPESPHRGYDALLNDFYVLGRSIELTDQKLHSYAGIIDQQNQRIRTQLLECALHRGLYGQDELGNFIHVFQDFPKAYRLAQYLYSEIPQATDIAFQLDLRDAIAGLMPNIYDQYAETLGIILILPENDAEVDCAESDWEEPLNRLLQEISRRFAVELRCQLSTVFLHPQDMAEAYEQLQYICTFSACNGENRIEVIGRLPITREAVPFGYSTLNALYNALIAGKTTIVEEVLQTVIQSADSWHSATQLHAHNLLSGMLSHLRLEYGEILSSISIPRYEPNLSTASLAQKFLQCFREVCERINTTKISSADLQAQHVMAFIETNLFDSDLYMGMVSAALGISGPTIQKIVKQMTGCTFFGYIERRRMAKALELVTDETLNLQDVAEQCGFASANSFYKAFRRYYGYSPRNNE